VAAAPNTANEDYTLKMRELQDLVGELKEKIHRSKAKLDLLNDALVGGATTGSKLVVIHKNQMGANFLLTEVSYFLDGQPLWQEVDETGRKLTEMREHTVQDGSIVQGSHTLTVRLVYKGDGNGVFKYLAGYTWRLKDSITFNSEPGKVLTISTVGYEQGNFTTEMTERPKIRFDSNVASDTRAHPKSAEAKP
jgi:hypothetical protein